MSDLIDISQPLQTGISVWPGDTPYQTFWMMRMDDGDSCNVGSVTMSLHTGTHADAPRHFLKDGNSVDHCALDAFAGPATVVDASRESCVDLSLVQSLEDRSPERVLFKTKSSDASGFSPSFSYIAEDAALALVRLGVRLVGLDTPSVDKSDSRSLASHKTFSGANIAILENLDLGGVAPGDYELFAFPLKLRGMDASPVRAVLRRL